MAGPVYTTELDKYVVGQKRTSVNKAFVVYVSSKYVDKGPFKADSPRLRNILTRSAILKAWQTPCIVHPISSYTTSEGVWLRFDNLLGRVPTLTEDYTEKSGDYSYKITRETDLRTLADDGLTSKKKYQPLSDLLTALLHLYILGVGDMNTRNVMLRDDSKQINFYINDYDDNAGTSRKLSIKTLTEFYFNGPSKGLFVHQALKKYYADAVLDLQEFENQHDLNFIGTNNYDVIIDNINTAIDLLEMHTRPKIYRQVETKPEQYAVKLLDAAQLYADVKDNLDITPKDDAILKSSVKARLEKQGAIKVMPSASKKSKPVPTKSSKTSLDPHRAGQRKYSYRGAKTEHGYSVSLIKSALQKNIRRGQEEQALYCAFELFRYTIDPEAKAAITNLYNRLTIIACEDVSPGEMLNVLPIIASINQIKKTKDYDATALMSIVLSLARAPKARIGSWLWNAYINTPDYSEPLTEKMFSYYNKIYTSRKASYLRTSDYQDLDKKWLLALIAFQTCLADHNAYCIVWLHYLHENLNNQKIKALNRRTSPEMLIWHVMETMFKAKSIDISPMYIAYFTVSEWRPIMIYCICFLLYDVANAGVDEPDTDDYDLDMLLDADFTIQIDESYMADKHTGKKGNAQELDQQFVTLGALVNNQDPNYYDAELEELYMNREFKKPKPIATLGYSKK